MCIRDSSSSEELFDSDNVDIWLFPQNRSCLLYTSDAADDMQCVDLGGRRIIKKHRNVGCVWEYESGRGGL